jgi:hypothetical protein
MSTIYITSPPCRLYVGSGTLYFSGPSDRAKRSALLHKTEGWRLLHSGGIQTTLRYSEEYVMVGHVARTEDRRYECRVLVNTLIGKIKLERQAKVDE